MARTKPEPIKYAILWAIMADRELISSTKNVATALLVEFQNTETGQCNPSYRKMADIIGLSRDTVLDAVNELEAAGYLTVSGTKGGSARNTNQFEFHLKVGRVGEPPPPVEKHDTGEGSVVDRSGGDDPEGVERPPHELSIEPSRTTAKKLIEADSPQGDELRRYWRSKGAMEPYRMDRGRYITNSVGIRPCVGAHSRKRLRNEEADDPAECLITCGRAINSD